jgi:hypothetical protein
MIIVCYRADKSVHSAERYWFFSLDNLQLRDRTPDRHAKETVFSWLAEVA